MLIITKPIIGLLIMAAAAFGEPGQGQGLAPFHAAQAAFDEAIGSFANVGPDHCYTNTSAAKLDIEELKSKFESYRMALLKVNRTALPGGAKKDLKEGFKAKQKIFAATKRSLRTKKRAAKLGGKRCFWTRNPTPPPTESPTTTSPTQPPTTSPTQPPTQGPTEGPTTSPPTTSPTPLHDFTIGASDNCTARIEELQKYDFIPGDLIIKESTCTSIELNFLTGIGGRLRIDKNGQLSTFNASVLEIIGGHLLLTNNDQIDTFTADKLMKLGFSGLMDAWTRKGGILHVFNNKKLSTLGLADLEMIETKVNIFANGQASGNFIDLCSTALQDVCTGARCDDTCDPTTAPCYVLNCY